MLLNALLLSFKQQSAATYSVTINAWSGKTVPAWELSLWLQISYCILKILFIIVSQKSGVCFPEGHVMSCQPLQAVVTTKRLKYNALVFTDNCVWFAVANLEYSWNTSDQCNYTNTTGWAKKRPNLFLSGLHQISSKFDNFWHTDSQDHKLIWDTLTVHFT